MRRRRDVGLGASSLSSTHDGARASRMRQRAQPGGAHEDLYYALAFIAVVFAVCAFLARRAAMQPPIKITKRD